MAALPLLAPLTLVVLAAALVCLVVVRTAVPDGGLAAPVAAARRHALGAGVAAWLGGLLGAALLTASSVPAGLAPGAGAVGLPVGFALGHSIVVLLGEATWPRPRSTVRAAVLARRSAASVAPTWLRRTWWAALVLLAVVAAAGTVTADGSGRALTATDGAWTGSHGPYPGAPYAVPALIGTALLALVVEGGLRLVATRPAVPGPAQDHRLRLASAHRLLRGATAGVLALTAGLVAVAGSAVHGLFQGSWGGVAGDQQLLGSVPVLADLGTALAVLGAGCALAAAGLLLVPAPRLRPTVPAPATA